MKFNTNSPFFQFMRTLVSFTGFNLVFLLTCIPIFTIGTALTAMYATTLKYIDNEDISLTRVYLRNFKSNFKASVSVFLIWALFVAIIGFGIAFWWNFPSVISLPIVIILGLAALIIILVGEFAFPLTARYQNTLKETFKNAALIAISNFFKGLLLVAIDLSAIALFYLSDFARVMILIFGFAFVAYLKSFVLKKVFARYSNE